MERVPASGWPLSEETGVANGVNGGPRLLQDGEREIAAYEEGSTVPKTPSSTTFSESGATRARWPGLLRKGTCFWSPWTGGAPATA